VYAIQEADAERALLELEREERRMARELKEGETVPEALETVPEALAPGAFGDTGRGTLLKPSFGVRTRSAAFPRARRPRR
jgi:hypothetical protein